jgi:flagellar biogenesis protein FliO
MLTRMLAAVREAVRHVKVRRCVRSLRVCETLALGERRFLLVVQCEHRRYLIGTTSQAITLLQRLDEPGSAAAAGISAMESMQ